MFVSYLLEAIDYTTEEMQQSPGAAARHLRCSMNDIRKRVHEIMKEFKKNGFNNGHIAAILDKA